QHSGSCPRHQPATQCSSPPLSLSLPRKGGGDDVARAFATHAMSLRQTPCFRPLPPSAIVPSVPPALRGIPVQRPADGSPPSRGLTDRSMRRATPPRGENVSWQPSKDAPS